jgi:hypothetical protein
MGCEEHLEAVAESRKGETTFEFCVGLVMFTSAKAGTAQTIRANRNKARLFIEIPIFFSYGSALSGLQDDILPEPAL